MFRFITLMNPPKKNMRTMRRRIARRSRSVAIANPPRRSRRAKRVGKPAVARRSRHHSPAMRAKISRAVKRAMRSRRSSGAVMRTSSRRRSMTSYRPRSAARRMSSGGLYVIKGRKLNPQRRRQFRRRRNPGGLSSITGLLTKDVMMIAGGAVAASVGTGYVLSKFGASLPMASTTYGRIAYQLAIPVAAAYFLRNKFRTFATGMVVGGVVMAITTVMKQATGATAAAAASPSTVVQGPLGNFYEVKGMGLAGEIGGSRKVRGLNAYIGPKTFHTIPDAVNSPVFAGGAWG